MWPYIRHGNNIGTVHHSNFANQLNYFLNSEMLEPFHSAKQPVATQSTSAAASRSRIFTTTS
jgi:hypothetical protein